jgi:hypothetical protein
MSTTISGTSTLTVNLASPRYASPTTITGIISSAYNAVAIGTPWSVDVTGTLASQTEFGVFALAATTLQNSGLIEAASKAALYFGAGGGINNTRTGEIIGGVYGIDAGNAGLSITNAGHISGTYAAIRQASGGIDNLATGTITGGTIGLGVTQYAVVQNAGLITGGSFGIKLPQGALQNTGTIIAPTAIYMAGGNLTNAGYIASGTLNSHGSIVANPSGTAIQFTAAGTFTEDAGGIILGSVIGDGGTLALGAGNSSLAGLGTSITGFGTDAFLPGAAATLTGLASAFGTITGFGEGDTLHLTNIAATSGNFANGELALKVGPFLIGEDLTFAGSYTGDPFTVNIDPNGGTDITIPCFLAGTRIRTREGDVAVEKLRIGDVLPTLHGGEKPIIWIGRRDYQARFIAGNADVLPICVKTGALGAKIPARDLFLSPGHALYIDGVLIPARDLVNAVSIIEMPAQDISYFHIELDGHEVIFAENAPVESFLDTGCRQQFENAATYGCPAAGLPMYRRLEDGFAVAGAKTRLAARAGLPQVPALHGPLRGFLESDRPGEIRGWAQCSLQPDIPVCLDILADGKLAGRILANRHRADLRRAGFGRGFSGFCIALPTATSFLLRRSIDGAPLPLAAHARAA